MNTARAREFAPANQTSGIGRFAKIAGRRGRFVPKTYGEPEPSCAPNHTNFTTYCRTWVCATYYMSEIAKRHIQAYNRMMPRSALTDVSAREAFHVLLLRRMADEIGTDGWRLKGGVNLRLFFGSPRYSQDMDLDGLPRVRARLRRDLRRLLSSRPFRQRLARLGIRDIGAADVRPSKDSETTLRFKLGLLVGGGVSLSTKIEVSFREGCAEDEVLVERADDKIADRYLDSAELPLFVPHYAKDPAVRQKIAALAGRSYAQARDVFDLRLIAGGSLSGLDLTVLRRNLSDETLHGASSRAVGLPHKEYEDKVLEFLEPEDRARFANTWEDQQLFAVELAEALLVLPAAPSTENADSGGTSEAGTA